MCGEHPRSRLSLSLIRGSSPHVRGALISGSLLIAWLGIIPACAGSTVEQLFLTTVMGDHPRMCGEHYVHDQSEVSDGGSSPHVRGALQFVVAEIQMPGIIPACAGST